MQTEFINFMNQFNRGSPFSETDAIVDILTMADENGEFYSTIRQLMDRWKWGNTRTTSFIKQLEKQDIIKTQTRHKQDTLYRIDTEFLCMPQDTNETQTRHKQDTKKTENTQEIVENIPKQKTFVPPTVEQVEQYCIERNNTVDAQKFVDFYESKGWYVGKNKMKDWKAAVRTWENTEKKKNQNRQSNSRSDINASRQSQLEYLLNSIKEDEENAKNGG